MVVTRPVLRAAAATAAASLALALAAAAPASATRPAPPPSGTSPVLVTDELVSPLHLAAGPGGHAVYVADAFPGRVVRVDVSKKDAPATTIAEGLGFVPGVALRGEKVYVVGSSGGESPEEPGLTYFARLTRDGSLTAVRDLLEFELENNPDQQPLNEDAQSNPYDVLAYRGGFIVADAGANDLLRVTRRGRVSLLTALPLDVAPPCNDPTGAGDNNGDIVGCDAVPTGIALGPDGYLYVSGLGAFVRGHVWKIDPGTGEIVETLTEGLPEAPPLTDIAVAPEGSLYVCSLPADRVYRLRDGVLSEATVPSPTGLLWSRGTLYVGSAPAAMEQPGPGALYAVPEGAFTPLVLDPV